MTGPSGTPRTPLIPLLTRLWQTALGVEGITPEENFFDLGGDSMTATAIATDIARETGTDTAVRLIFDHPTIGELADALAAVAR
ncbi:MULTISPECIES: acyl carrier protein [unclassified Streptomyces]|uniref:acyl carrier protein n=1 Tax=unclassified Streptomyces TaxID=2593676 RepID=UPI002E30ECF9|nr:acyl carrier protein [Streptomyces sp. NBC_01477]